MKKPTDLKKISNEVRNRLSQLMLKAADINLLMEHELRLHRTVNLETYNLYNKIKREIEVELRRLLQ